MKKKDIPQDAGKLDDVSKELYYAQENDSGKYTTGLSKGWEIKSEALNVAWGDIHERAAKARQKVENGEASPILYFMEMRMMDLALLSSYTGFWKWTIKRHLNMKVFKKLSPGKLLKYAEAFDVSVEDLIQMRNHEN